MSVHFRLSVWQLASLVALVPTIAFGATGYGTWNQQPDWAREASTSSRKISSVPERRYSPIAPFIPGSNNFGIDVGQVFLMGELGANYSDNIGFQLHYTYGVSDLFAFDTSVGYSGHADGLFSMTTALAGLRTNLAWYDKVIPYATFGLGFYKPSYHQVIGTDATGNLSSSNSVSPVLFGVHFGPGVDLELTKQLFFGTSITFHDVFGTTKQTTKGPLSVGGTFTSFLLRAGVTF